MMSYNDSPPAGFPSDISMQVEPAYSIPHEHFMVSCLMLQRCHLINWVGYRRDIIALLNRLGQYTTLKKVRVHIFETSEQGIHPL